MSNLHEIITNILAKISKNQSQKWMLYSPVTLPTTIEQDIVRVNEFLRIQLGLLNADVLEARKCLVDQELPKEWIKNFEREVAPVIARHGLPIWYE